MGGISLTGKNGTLQESLLLAFSFILWLSMFFFNLSQHFLSTENAIWTTFCGLFTASDLLCGLANTVASGIWFGGLIICVSENQRKQTGNEGLGLAVQENELEPCHLSYSQWMWVEISPEGDFKKVSAALEMYPNLRTFWGLPITSYDRERNAWLCGEGILSWFSLIFWVLWLWLPWGHTDIFKRILTAWITGK